MVLLNSTREKYCYYNDNLKIYTSGLKVNLKIDNDIYLSLQYYWDKINIRGLDHVLSIML